MNEINQKIKEIADLLFQGKAALFLGAGATQAAGGPSGQILIELIKKQFPKSDQACNNLIDLCQDVIDTPPYNRNMLEEFVRSKLEGLQPTEAHKIMTKFDWSAIFTTNYDDLIEFAYRSSEVKIKRLQSIYSERYSANPSDRSKVYLFKIMGSITATEEETGNMVLSRADYNLALSRRKKYLDSLFDFVKNGTLVFIGYSFEDRIVLDIIDEIKEIYGKERLPFSYALFDKVPNDEKTTYMLQSRKIIPLECDFASFFKTVNSLPELKTKAKEPVAGPRKTYLKLRGYTLEFNEDDFRQYAEFFDVLSEETMQQPPGEKDNFFKGINNNWGAFRENWDFQRDLYSLPQFKRNYKGKNITGCLKDRVSEELKKFDSKDNKIILLKGMGGVGKTYTTRRLAFDVCKNGEAPVIFIKTTKAGFDYKLLTSLLEDLNYQLNQKVTPGQRIPPLKPLIVMDNAASMMRHVNRIKDYLTSRGRSAIMIASERTGEWDLNWKTFKFNLPEEDVYELDEQLTLTEKKRIVEHFYNLGYIQTKGAFWDDIIDRTFANSYFATIYTLVHPSKKPLNEIIKDQYQNLTDLTQLAFKFICIFHQFDLPINLELLVRALKCGYDSFQTEVLNKDSAKVIFEEQDITGSILYRSHHRIIAQKTVEYFLGDPEMQKNIFIKILTEANLTNQKEREICQKLLVSYIGPNANPQRFTYDQQREIFKAICARSQTRSLLHHWGILETDDKKFEEAERLLKEALEVPRDEIESFRGESDQNILTSLGNLYSHLGMDLFKNSKTPEANEYFAKAEECFHSAKHGEFPNAHAYHSHARMWYTRGIQAKEEEYRLDAFGKSLEILSIAKDNLNEEELQPIIELEGLIYSQIGDEAKIARITDILKTKYKSPSGYYLHAEIIIAKAKDKPEAEKNKILGDALHKVTEALSFFPNDEHCLRLECRLIKQLEPQNLPKYFERLKKWKTVNAIQNIWLLYQLGRTAFILGYYDESRDAFRDLESGVGMGHKLRSRPRNPILDDKGNKKEFDGQILSIFSIYEGNIKCNSLRNLKTPIGFRPVACKFNPSIGDQAKFTIEFSFRGPRAEEVRKIS